MISYKQIDSQERMLKLKRKLEKDSYKVWMDVDTENLGMFRVNYFFFVFEIVKVFHKMCVEVSF